VRVPEPPPSKLISLSIFSGDRSRAHGNRRIFDHLSALMNPDIDKIDSIVIKMSARTTIEYVT
jgi:hypothetical protein